MKNLALVFALVLFAAPAWAQPVTVTVTDTVEWDNVNAASYEAQLQDGVGTVLTITLDPATNDPDGDKIVEIASDPDGVSQVSLALWLTGRALGSYTIFVRSIDANGNGGSWIPLALTYAGPPDVAPRVAGGLALALAAAYIFRRRRA